jgi:hypothetical protein
MKLIRISICALLLSTNTLAGSQNGTVDAVISTKSDRTFVSATGAHSSPPACSTLPRFAVDTSTDEGREMAQTIRLAAALGATVFLFGTGSCSLWPDSETLEYVLVSF